PFLILIVEVMPRSHQVETVDPTQRIGASGKSGRDPLSGRVNDAPVALTERGAPSFGFGGSDPANGLLLSSLHRPFPSGLTKRGEAAIAATISRSVKP